jgi:hypothetical protein
MTPADRAYAGTAILAMRSSPEPTEITVKSAPASASHTMALRATLNCDLCPHIIALIERMDWTEHCQVVVVAADRIRSRHQRQRKRPLRLCGHEEGTNGNVDQLAPILIRPVGASW